MVCSAVGAPLNISINSRYFALKKTLTNIEFGYTLVNSWKFSKALKDTKYYEADEKDYTRGMVAGVAAFNKRKSYEDALAGNFPAATPSAPIAAAPVKKDFLGQIGQLLERFLSAIAESERNNFIK